MFDYKKVGGINFLRMGRFTVSWSFKRKARREGKKVIAET